MVTVTAEMSLSSSLDDAWTALGRRATYLCFPGFEANGRPPTARRKGGRALAHTLDLPIVHRQAQETVLTVSRAGPDGRRERRFAMRGAMVAITGRWRLDPVPDGVRLRLTLDYDIAPPLKALAVDTLRSRSPLPIRTDADAILSRAVDEFFETRFSAQAAEYCERLRARLESRSA
jgi:hypothetical protein